MKKTNAMEKPTVLFLKFPLESIHGGGEVHTIQIAKSLRENGVSVFFAGSCRVLLSEFKKHNLPFRKTWGGIEPVSKFGILLFLLLWPFALINIVRLLLHYKKQERVSIVYCLSLTEKLLATIPAKLMGLQVIWAEHLSLDRWLTLNPFRFPFIWFSDFVELIAVSQSLKTELEQIGISSARIHVLYGGIDTQRFSPNAEAVISGTNFAQLKDKKIIGTVARLHREKGIEFLLRAFPIILASEPNSYLLVVGEGDDYSRLYALAKELKIQEQVFFVGYREDVAPFIKLMDVFVLPSAIRESFGMAAAEAMSMEKPVVASRIGGIPELVEDGESGYLVEPRNPEKIAQRVLELLKNKELAQKMGARGRDIITQKFTSASIAKQMQGLLERMVEEKPFRALFLKFPYKSAFGGGELHTIQLAEGLVHKGAEVLFVGSCQVLLPEFRKRNLYNKKAWAGIEVVSKTAIIMFPLMMPFILLRLFWLLLTYRLLHKIDVLYCMSLNEKILATIPARILGMRVFWVEHLLIERWLVQNPFRYFYVLASRSATTIAVSDAVKMQLITLGVHEKDVKVIYNGIDEKEFEQVEPASEILGLPRQKLEDEYDPVVGTACRLAQEKGLQYLLRAAKLVIEKMPKALFVIVGEGPERENLEQLARELGIHQRILFVGFAAHAQVLSYIKVCDMFVLTPISGESFGIAVAESMMLEKPVVATNIGGIPEVVSDKETGLVVRSKDVEAIANAIMQLAAYKEEAQIMGQKGKARALAMFTLDRMLDEFYEAFAVHS